MIESSAPPPKPDGYLTEVEWRYRDALFAFLGGFAGSLVVGIILTAGGFDLTDPIPFSLVFFGQASASLLVIWLLSRSRGTGSLAKDVGLVIQARDWWGVPAGMLLQIVIALITLPLILLLFGDDPPSQGVTDIAETATTTAEQIFVVISVAVLAPIVEEVIYRGMLLSTLRRQFRPWIAVVISAAVFSSIHAVLDINAIAAVPGLFLLGLVLGWVALRRQNLSLAIALHSGINLLAAISLLWGGRIQEWAENRIDEIEAIITFLPF